MAEFLVILVMGILVIPLVVLLRKNFVSGLAYAVFFWVFMTTFLRISFAGVIPDLTFHRLMLIVVTIFWVKENGLSMVRQTPLLGVFLFWAIANLISLLGTHIDFVTSLKRFLDFVLELFVFFVVISTSLKDRTDAFRVLRAAWLGLLCVAAFAVIERYSGFNPVDRYIPGYVRDDVATHDILSTYQHRILLGTAVAMGVPLGFALLEGEFQGERRVRWFWLATGLLISACYFAFSRGPWIGLVIACALLMVTGSRAIRLRLITIAAIAAIVMIARPGVFDTLSGFAHDTADKDSFKGGTFQYRLELWKVAGAEISKSPWTLLFGYGPGAGSEMEVQRELSYRGRSQKIESWDNQFAYALFQSGILGLIATVLLYGKALLLIFSGGQDPERHVVRTLLAVALIQVWMMSNVLVFAKQLDYLFWTIIAAGFTLFRERAGDELESAVCPCELRPLETT